MPYGRRGGEFVVNKKVVGTQYSPAVAGFDSGGFIVVWESSDPLQDGAGYSIKAQRYDSLGNVVGSEILVNSSAAGDQRLPSVTTLASGGWVVTWETTDTTQDGSGFAIKGQLFDSAGLPVGAEFRVNSQLTSNQITPSVTGLDGGGFVVTWRTSDTSQDGSGGAIKGQMYSAAGVAVGGEFLVNTGAVGGEAQPAVASLAGGGFVATWTLDSGGPYAGDIYAQIFNSSGAKVGTQFLVNSTTALSQTYSSVSQISGGRFVVTWEHTASTTSLDKEIRARIFNSDGTPVGSDFLVSTSKFDPDSGLRLSSYQPSVDDLPGGGFVITWTHSAGLAARSSIRGQFFDSNGNRVGSEVLMSTVTNRFEERGDVAVDGNGMVFAVWGGYNDTATDADVRGQVYGPSGAPAIVSNGGADVASVTVAENQSAVTTVAAVDPEGASLVYSIVGGVDAAFFTINASTGALTFASPPSYEWMLDWNNNGKYDVVVSVSDGVMTDIQALSVTVSNVNEAPVISGSQTSYSRVENGTAVATFTASDPELNAVTWSIAGGADAAYFAIDAATGALRFIAAPDFELRGDAGADNVYNVTIAASDGSLSATRALAVTVTNANEAPVIGSNGGGAAASVSVSENALAVTNVAAADPEGSAVTYSISGGADASRFLIDSATGALGFLTVPDFEQPGDADGDNVYQVVVRASDGTLFDTQALSISVTDVNEGVTITFGASASVVENGTAVMTVTAQDLDGDPVSFAISGGADSALFGIDSATGALSFIAAPNFEAPSDSDGDNVYEVEVSASDGTLSDSKSVAVTVTDQDEAIVIVSGGGGDEAAITVNENDAEVMNLVAVDPDGSTPGFSIMGGADRDSFYIDPVTQVLRFHSMSSDVRPDFETPRDSDGDNVYEVIVATTNGHSVDWQTISVTVANVYEGLGLGPSVSFSALEGTGEIGAISARREAGLSLAYSITGGVDASLFSINPVTGAISWADESDFEGPRDSDGDNVYHFEVTADDGITSDIQFVTVTVGNVDEPVEILSYGGAGTVSLTGEEGDFHVGWVEAADPEGDTVAYAIVLGADSARFTVDSSTGELTFASRPDFEAPADLDGDNVYEVTLAASAGGSTATQAFAVTVVNRNDGIFITSNGGDSSAGLTFEEGAGHVTTVVADDPDGTIPVYSITGGNDAALFTIDSATGVLRFVEAPDYETRRDVNADNFYEVIVAASDGELTSTQYVSVMITNVNEAVTITSGGGADSVSVTVGEDQSSVADVDAVDTDGTTVFYSIAGGADAAFFGIDLLTGALWIVGADHDLPGDADGDNVYEVIVAADDGWLSDSQAFSVTLADVDEPLSFTSYNGDFHVTLDSDENSLEAASVTAQDPEGGAIVYSIVESYDGASFTIDAQTGAVRFLTAPDHETPGDLDGDNVYTVLVAATDGAFFDFQTLSIHVGDVNEAPVIASPAAATVTENATAVSTVAADDDDGDTVSYAIAGGADAALFAIDAQTGALSFVQAPDFEAPADSDGDNVYDVIVSATDGDLAGSRAMAVTVANANEAVAITSDGGGAAAQIGVDENGTAVTVVAASDPDGGPVTYAITGGADADRFTIDSITGALAFVAAPDFESTRGAGGGNDFYVTVSASDGSSTDSQDFTVILENVVEGVFITSYGGTDSVSMSLIEGHYTVYDVDAWHDTEVFAPIVYTLSGADAAFFTIDSQGRFSFDYDAPPNFEGPADADGDNVYDVTVTASISAYSDSQSFAITVVNRDESVVLTSGGGEPFASFTMAENGTVAATVSAVDPEGGTVTYAISGGFDAARFTIDPDTGVLSFVDAPDFENPTDAGWYGDYAALDNVYNVSVTATDGTFGVTQFIDVTVENVDEPIEILSYGGASAVALTLTEGNVTVGTVEADDEEDWIVTYAITGGADAALFRVDASTGILSFNYGVYPDFEAPADSGGDNVYDVIVTASSSTSSADQAFAITVADRNEGLWITSDGGGDADLILNEGDRNVTVVTAEDPDGDVPTYSIAGGADSALFAIDSATGALAFIAAPDFEAPGSAAGTNTYIVEVGASDGEFTGTQRIRVTIGNVNEAPVITSGGGGEAAAVTVNENGLAAASLAAGDVDGNPLTWSIVGGADASRFTIEASSGVLTFVQAPNFEAPGDAGGDNVYNLIVSVSDGVLTDSQAVAITVANVSEAVAITSNGGGAAASVALAENGLAVTHVSAADPDGGAVTYAISGGADAARFTIDPGTGALAFVSAPNYEAPADSGGDNVYDVIVSASDGSSTDTQAVAVQVGNVNEAPAIGSNGGGAAATVSVAENSLAVTTVSAGDPDGTAATYSIVGGVDAARFTIDPQTGLLQFVAAPDWELPADFGGDNVYAVVVRASDGQLFDDQSLSVTVGNVRDGNNVTGTSGSDSISATSTNVALRTSNEEDSVFGRDGHDTIQGMAGDDELYGEGGNDTLVGGSGADRLTGGLGKDQHVYNSVSESTASARDVILDFSRAQGDKISLSAIDSNSLVSSNQAFTFIGTAAFSNVAGQLRYETSGGVTTISGDVDGDSVADLVIQLSGSIALISSDFIL